MYCVQICLVFVGPQILCAIPGLVRRSITTICNSYNMGTWDLPDIYAQAWGPQARVHGHIYQANPKCPCYK